MVINFKKGEKINFNLIKGKKDGTVNGCKLPNGNKLGKCIRYEMRMLTDEQRQAYFKTIKEMKANNDYLIMATLHKQAWDDGAAHNGPCFLPWHREFLKVFELAMREASYKILQTADVCLPYWDSTLDARLPTPKDSYFFTADFIGSTNDIGQVIDGPFSPWETLMNTEYIERDVGSHGACYQEERFTWQMQQTDITNIIAYSQPPNRDKCPYKAQAGYPEYAHGGVHTFVGKYMSDPGTSANDPCFFNHHSFIDLLFEEWRKARQDYNRRPLDYPVDNPDCETEVNYKNQNMSQFPYIRNIDGCRNEYTDNMYEYAPRPNCSTYKPDCGSKYLFCDLSNGDPHCAAKARPGGNCTGFFKGEKKFVITVNV
ncbi:unnamed protein product [Meloidogyne enterolobii]|uniref:Uncharacterized protein n=1 Tax=Meloidogyne enterolobii TaxID=390850 RepID=A0ACB0YTV3_MELEN